VRTFFLPLILIAGVIPCFSESEVLSHTRGWSNGRIWQSMDRSQKISYLMGADDGESHLMNEVESVDPVLAKRIEGILNPQQIKTPIKQSEIASVIDDFYRDAANLRLPVAFALTWASMKINGTEESELSRYVIGMKKWADSSTSPER